MNDSVDMMTAYGPRGGALDLFYCQDTEILMEGPAGTGKTRAVLEKAHLCAMKYPGARVLLLRQTRESMTESVLVTFEQHVVPEGSPILNGPKRQGRQNYIYPNGSQVTVGAFKASGKDQRAKIMSTEYDLICIFEATEVGEADYEQALTRLRNGVIPYQQAICDCNPDGRMHWLNLRAATTMVTRILSRHPDNPTLHDGDDWTRTGASYMGKLARLTGHRKARLKDGLWATAEGVVYDTYDRAIHLVDRFDVPAEWARIRVIDFGYQNPFVCQWWCLDGDGRAYLYRELYRTKRIVSDHAKQIIEWSQGESYTVTLADHDAEDRATLDAVGISTQAAKKQVTPGIEAVQARLMVQDDGRPRLFIMRGALRQRDDLLVEAKKPCCTDEEFDGYIWPKGQDGKALKEAPVKDDDHGMDCMRYLCNHLDGASAWCGVITAADDEPLTYDDW